MSPKPAKKKSTASAKRPSAKVWPRDAIALLGEDGLCDRVDAGESVNQVAVSIGVTRRSLWDWIDAEPTRSARVREALKNSAAEYDDKAEKVLLDLPRDATPAEVARARELAQHYRWRASKRNPKKYGDKLQLGGAEDLPPMQHNIKQTPEEAYLAMLNGSAISAANR
jgi:hypothetical protein